jgi:hypothetical protein
MITTATRENKMMARLLTVKLQRKVFRQGLVFFALPLCGVLRLSTGLLRLSESICAGSFNQIVM